MNKMLVIGLLLAATTAAAAPHQRLSFEDLKMACQDPKKFQNQIEPTSIRLDCSDKVVKFVPCAGEATGCGNGSMTLPAKRVIFFNVSSDKYTVPNSQEEVRTEPLVEACPVYKQIEETIAVSQEVTCEQLKTYQGTATQLCLSLLDGLKTENPSAIKVRETGKVASFCKPDGEKGGTPSTPSKPGKPGMK